MMISSTTGRLVSSSRLSLSSLWVTSCGKQQVQQRRCLNLQEYQSKEIMSSHGLAVQRFTVIGQDFLGSTVSLEQLPPCDQYVVKAQVLAGGRGKGHFLKSGLKGGVKLTRDRKEAANLASQMINDRLVTQQTTAEGILVKKVMIAEALDIERELYVAILLDRGSGGGVAESGVVLVASPCGGMDIESVAATDPQKIKRYPLPPFVGDVDDKKLRTLVDQVVREGLELGSGGGGGGHDDVVIKNAIEQIMRLHSLFLQTDATMIEINPLGITPDGQVVCFDAKLDFDENAEFRQKWIRKYKQQEEEDEDMDTTASATGTTEKEAKEKFGLNFLRIPGGNIGCLVNGAGLAMATMDMISLAGGSPANFLDCGGGVRAEGVAAAFALIAADPNVKAVLVNIFGGIVDCDIIAQGLLTSVPLLHQLPLIVRLEGTNRDAAYDRIRKSNSSDSNIIIATDLSDAAHKAVTAAAAKN